MENEGNAEMERRRKDLIFRCVASITRRKILIQLARGKLCVNAISERVELPQATVSRALGILTTAGIVNGLRRGQQVFYELTPTSEARCVKKFLKDMGEVG